MTTATNVVGNGAYTYEFDRNWAQVPDGVAMPAAAVFGDDEDRVYCFNRNPEHPIMIFDRDGKFIKSWGRRHVRVSPCHHHRPVGIRVARGPQHGSDLQAHQGR